MNSLKKFDLDIKNKFGVKYVAGYDEAGRGALCGPLTAACCIMPDEYFNETIKDSKQLTESQRFDLQKEIIDNAVYFDIRSYYPDEIDKFGIQHLNIEIFRKLKSGIKQDSVVHLIDGNIMESEQWCHILIKGDNLSFSIACASILAKYTRDKYMIDISKDYPQYNLDHNKGYGQEYIALVKKLGIPNTIHRKSYKIKEKDQITLF